MKRHALLAFALALSAYGVSGRAFAQAQNVPAGDRPEELAVPSNIFPDRPDDAAPGSPAADLLGAEFESRGNGIALRPPKDFTAQRRVGTQDIIEFVNEEKDWTLKLSKIMLAQPGSLSEWRNTHGEPQPGVLEFTATRLKEEIPDAEFLRQEKINIGDGDVGMLALRYTRNLKSLLTQQAIIQRTDQMYYLLALTTPGAPKGSPEADAAKIEGAAVRTFQQVLDSVKMLDLRGVREDQDQRLYRTRGLLVNLTPTRLKKVLQKQHWTRILKNGKDIGYTYVEERADLKGGQEGIEIRTRSRMLPGNDTQADIGSIYHVSMDLRHEDWSTLAERFNIKQRAANPEKFKPPQLTETGISDRKSIPGRGDDYTLSVVFESNSERVEPVNRELPPFYLPQAVSHLLPRLVPVNEPKAYMFMIYVPDVREVMMRYVDVLEVTKIEFNGKTIRAVPVNDRLGLEGPVTTHYVSPDGKWLGSDSKDTGITAIPSDEETLLKLWQDANLTVPDAPEKKGDQAEVDAAALDADEPKPRQAKGPRAVQRPAPKRVGADAKSN
jgi:hypothetical protein